MPLNMISPSRTVLIIGDENLSLYAAGRTSVRLIESVQWQAADFAQRVVRLIRQEGSGKPVLLVNDMTDQHFKGGQRMPKVSVMDRKGVLDRKLQVAFANYPIRGALEIKRGKKEKFSSDTDNATEAPSKGGTYLFAAVPMSEQMTKTMEAVRLSLASIAGLVLLPVDSSDMVASLSAKLTAKAQYPSRWAIFVGQHRGGGLRQVITRDGQLAMTRMTPISDSGTLEEWTAEVVHELKATVSYLSRFGYAPEDGTDLIVVSTPESGERLKEDIDIPCNFTTVTVNEAARLLGLGIGLQEDQHFADPLHAAWIGRKSKFLLPMDASELSSVSRPRQYATAAMVLLLCATAYLGWMLFSQFTLMNDNRAKLRDANQALVTAQADENTEVQRMQALGFDIKLIQAAIGTYGDLEKNTLQPLFPIQKIGLALGNELRLASLKISLVEPGEGLLPSMVADVAAMAAGGDPNAPKSKEMVAVLTMNFPATMEPAEGVRQVDELRARLQSNLPKYTVAITRQVADLTYTTATSGKAGADKEGTPSQDYLAELQIRGPAHE